MFVYKKVQSAQKKIYLSNKAMKLHVFFTITPPPKIEQLWGLSL